jgi:hypothetical protein
MERFKALFTRRRPRARLNKNVQLEPGPYNAYTLKQELKQQLKEEHIKLMDLIQKLGEQNDINSVKNGRAVGVRKGELNYHIKINSLYNKTLEKINRIERELNIELTGDLWKEISDNKYANQEYRRRISEQVNKDHKLAVGLRTKSALQSRLHNQSLRGQSSISRANTSRSRANTSRSHTSRSKNRSNGFSNNDIQHVMNLSMGIHNPSGIHNPRGIHNPMRENYESVPVPVPVNVQGKATSKKSKKQTRVHFL